MSFEVKVVEDSISAAGKRLTTLQLRYPRFIHAEFMTHRVFSRNASSSRAIPVKRMLEMVRTEAAMPIHWGKNQPGMQADVECDWVEQIAAEWQWQFAANQAANVAETMMKMNLHKQVVNRILEPFQHISVIVTATEWENFFHLRDHKDAQPEIRHLAGMMKQAMDDSKPTLLHPGEWHTPYVDKVWGGYDDEELLGYTPDKRAEKPVLIPLGEALQVSSARCARVSYLTHDGKVASVDDEIALYERLVGSEPLHASPVEHQATPFDSPTKKSKNFVGWFQHREAVEISMHNRKPK